MVYLDELIHQRTKFNTMDNAKYPLSRNRKPSRNQKNVYGLWNIYIVSKSAYKSTHLFHILINFQKKLQNFANYSQGIESSKNCWKKKITNKMEL